MVDESALRQIVINFKNSELITVGECPHCYALIVDEKWEAHVKKMHPEIPANLGLRGINQFEAHAIREEY